MTEHSGGRDEVDAVVLGITTELIPHLSSQGGVHKSLPKRGAAPRLRLDPLRTRLCSSSGGPLRLWVSTEVAKFP